MSNSLLLSRQFDAPAVFSMVLVFIHHDDLLFFPIRIRLDRYTREDK